MSGIKDPFEKDRLIRIKESFRRNGRMMGWTEEQIDKVMRTWGMKKEVDLSKVDWGKLSEDIEYEKI